MENYEIEKNSEPEITNNEYDNIIKELKQKLKNERNIHSNEIQRLKNELNNKNSNIKNVSQINTNLKNSLEQLSSKVDKLIEQSQNNVIREHKVRKERVLSPEIDLKIKENELKNSQTLVNILTKDNNRLKNLIENYSATSSNYDLNMKIYEKKQECEQIKIEIRRLQEIGKKHQKCQKERENLQKKIALLGKEINRIKQKESLIKIKFQNFEVKNQESNRAYEIFQRNLKMRKSEEKKRDSSFGKNNMERIQSQKKLLMSEQNVQNLMETIETFSDEEKEKLFEFYDRDVEKYENFLKKVDTIEK